MKVKLMMPMAYAVEELSEETIKAILTSRWTLVIISLTVYLMINFQCLINVAGLKLNSGINAAIVGVKHTIFSV